MVMIVLLALDHWATQITQYIKPCNAAQCVTFPIDRGPDLGKNWVGLGKLCKLVARRSMVILCVLLDDSITGLQVYTVAL